MSDKANKRRPVEERIGALQGRGSFCDGQGFGGLPSLTDQDVAAALAMIRKKRNLLGDAPDIAPELLEAYYGSTDQHRAVLRAAYLRQHPLAMPGDAQRVPCRRMAASIAAQMVAGVPYSRGQQAEYAYICHVRLETMREEIADAFAWFQNEAANASIAFRQVVESARIVRIEKAQGRAGELLERRRVAQAMQRAKRVTEADPV